MNGLEIAGVLVTIIALAVAIAFGAYQICYARGFMKVLKQDMESLRKESIEPLRKSLFHSHRTALHEKMAMMQVYSNTDFKADTWKINKLLADVEAASCIKGVASPDERKRWVITLDLLVDKLNSETPLMAEQIRSIKYYLEEWRKL